MLCLHVMSVVFPMRWRLQVFTIEDTAALSGYCSIPNTGITGSVEGESAHSRPNPKSTYSTTLFERLAFSFQKTTIGYNTRHISVKAERPGSHEDALCCSNPNIPLLTTLKEGKVLVSDSTVTGTGNCLVP